eukprot:m.595208 g.595208  ORF g.595208 m.595208 type:complete len:59 (+) comp22399_c1_seq42:373-549(+)
MLHHNAHRLPRETVASIDVYERDPREKDQGAGFDLDKTSQKALERYLSADTPAGVSSV